MCNISSFRGNMGNRCSYISRGWEALEFPRFHAILEILDIVPEQFSVILERLEIWLLTFSGVTFLFAFKSWPWKRELPLKGSIIFKLQNMASQAKPLWSADADRNSMQNAGKIAARSLI